jgi:hypothetical protein
MPKVVVMLKGGLGNQLFCYAAARRLALVNDAELVLDHVSGFARDLIYRRNYGLDKFHISAREATPRERLEPFGRYRRKLANLLSRQRAFQKRRYVRQERLDFDPRLLDIEVRGTVYLDGYWQSEEYFKDAEAVIRDDLRIAPPQDAANKAMAERIGSVNSVCVHVRWFEQPAPIKPSCGYNLHTNYYVRAARRIMARVRDPHFFVFSDHPDSTRQMLPWPDDMITLVNHNRGEENTYADLWLMTQCKHFIIANSTFSWWGAWLAAWPTKFVISPKIRLSGMAAWGFPGLIPEEWIELSLSCQDGV